ncbi:MAG: calcium-translocating P-type ATPase, PMCA-type [Bacilli bacterium]|nr:calcium-translocating P-type ATPase, PMCA-type [Bacilli bacterium]
MEFNGLTDAEVIEAREKYGSNNIEAKNENHFFKLLIESFGDPIIKILLIALAVKVVFLFREFDWFETLGIFIAIFLASFISSISEYGSGKAFNKLLEKNSEIFTRVRRNNKITNILVGDLVVGDIVMLSAGEAVSADGIIVKGEVTVDESSLTGESYEVSKKAVNNQVTEKNKLYKGSVVYSKECIMKITHVGNNTLYGNVAQELGEQNPESPLKLRLKHLAKVISKMGYIAAILVFFSYLLSVIVISNDFEMEAILSILNNPTLIIDYVIHGLTLAVTIIIVSVPEGLPMMVALVLSTNMKKLLKDNVLVRKLVGIETAGSLNLLLTDKTGTLTKGELSVLGVCDYYGRIFNNEIELMKYPKYLNIIAKSININNSSEIVDNKILGGNTTDQALKKFITTYEKEEIIIREPFDSNLKYSSATTKENFYIKGASEVILPKCKYYLDKNNKKELLTNPQNIEKMISKYTQKGMRIIMLAYNDKHISHELTYIGIVIIQDEIRNDAYEGVKLIQDAGIKVILITGDALDTALVVGKSLKILNNNEIALTSNEFNNLSNDEIKEILPKLKIIARAKPIDKSRLVKIAQELNLVVGMTGDGVNDAPALKKADVGFSMGSGTEVAKEASDIVILDDNIKSISNAVLFGRTIFKNIRKFIIFQLTVNICAMTLSIIGPFIGISTPVTVMQMLWINMIMDTLAGLAFAYEGSNIEFMKEKPKDKNVPIINNYMYGEIIITGFYSSFLCILFLKLPIFKDLIRYDVNNYYFMTAFFALFIFIGIFNAFNARTKARNLFYNITQNKVFLIIFLLVTLIQIYLIYYGGNIFRTYGLTIKEFILIIMIAFSVIPFDIARKTYLIKKNNKEYL